MDIKGIEGMTTAEVRSHIANGGRFVFFYWTISILIMSFRRTSPIYFIKPGESHLGRAIPWTLLSLLVGWWGLPWGIIYTIQALFTNLSGGKDVTGEVMQQVS
jgi:hypothetical protein